MQIYVVYEGVAAPIEALTDWMLRYCDQDNWLQDWVFAEADSCEMAKLVASAVAKNINQREGRVRQKYENLRDKYRLRLLSLCRMSPVEILGSIKSQHQATLIFKQGWVQL
jgi:hypothetical protein